MTTLCGGNGFEGMAIWMEWGLLKRLLLFGSRFGGVVSARELASRLVGGWKLELEIDVGRAVATAEGRVVTG